MAESPDPRSGVDEHGDWTPAFEGQRPPFQPGHDLSVRHGAYSTLKLAPRADELATELRQVMPWYGPADEVAVRLLALTLARIEAATAALDVVDDRLDGIRTADETKRAQRLRAYVTDGEPENLAGSLQRLRDDLKGWIRLSRSLANDLGMTPTARAKLGLDLVQARSAQSRLEEHVRDRYGDAPAEEVEA